MATAKKPAGKKVAPGSDINLTTSQKISDVDAIPATQEGYINAYGGSAPVSMDVISTQDREWVMRLLVSSSQIGKAAYITAAKCIVAIEKHLKPGETKYGVLDAAGFTKSEIQNGSQLAHIWDDFVEAGHMSEAVYDRLVFRNALDLKAVAKKRSIQLVREVFLTHGENVKAALDEIHQIAETGMTTAEEKDAKRVATEKAAKAEEFKRAAEQQAAKDAAAKAAEAPPPAATPAATSAPAPAPAEATPAPSAPIASEVTPEATPTASVTPSAPVATKATTTAPATPAVTAPAKVATFDHAAKVAEVKKLLDAVAEIVEDIVTSGSPQEVRAVAEAVAAFAKSVEGEVMAVA